MKTMLHVQENAKYTKKLIVFGLFFLAGAITLSGMLFSMYSILNGVSIKVMNVNVPGMVFGLMVVYLGIRSIFSVNKLRPELYRDDAKFSWSNFKRLKTAKNK